jgi:hypothetical protein
MTRCLPDDDDEDFDDDIDDDDDSEGDEDDDDDEEVETWQVSHILRKQAPLGLTSIPERA